MPEGVILRVREKLGIGQALVCENHFAWPMLEIGVSLQYIRDQWHCKWIDMANLMPDEDEDNEGDEEE